MKKVFVCAVAFIIFCGCKKSEVLSTPALNSYYPLQTGSVLIYRLDSTAPSSFGASLQVKSYHAKDSVITSFTDNSGRLSYTVFRYITDTLEAAPWSYQATYYVTPSDKKIELVNEDNLRFIKLVEPVSNGFSWQGNAYIDTKSGTSSYQYLDGWDYTYENINLPYETINGMIDSTITVMQRDETSPEGPFDPDFYQQRNYSIEVYGKGIGLIYKDFLHWTWQVTPVAGYESNSYGVKLNLIRR